MTRLYYEIIKDIPHALNDLDNKLMESTGENLFGLAARTIKLPPEMIRDKIVGCTAAVIPITSGQGLISGFSEAVVAIIEHLGLRAFITKQHDIAGFGEAFGKKVDVLFAADDNRFLALNLKNAMVVDNNWATAVGFSQALAATAKKNNTGLEGEDVLVIGLGPVGVFAVEELKNLGAKVWVNDINDDKLKEFANQFEDIKIVENINDGMERINYVLDATPAGGLINEYMISNNTVVSCPGVPHCLTESARQRIGTRFIHDNLPLGVAVMVLNSIAKPGD